MQKILDSKKVMVMTINSLTREVIAELIFQRIVEKKKDIKEQYDKSKCKIGCFFVDDLLPVEITREISNYFPKHPDMTLRKNLRENKYVGVQMNRYHSILEETIYAFQNKKVVNLIKDICNIDDLHPDEQLYAGGISSMKKGQFLNPHLDNSHDKDRDKWRVLNLLFYVSPNWKKNNGGHLEIWPDGLKEKQTVLHSLFNRLIVMTTHHTSWHSVSPILVDASRNCISNYYFSNNPFFASDTFHVTTFRGRPEQKLRNQILKLDSYLRMGIRKIFKKGIAKNPQVYKKEK